MSIPPPPVPGFRYGSAAEYFREVPTNVLVREVQRLWQQLADHSAPLDARERNEHSVYTFLVALHERADRSVFDAAVALIGEDTPVSREQGLKILAEMGHPDSRPVFPETFTVLEQLASEETDPNVLAGLIACLGWTLKPRAFPTIKRFAPHPSPLVRSSVASNILGCAPNADDPDAIATLLMLSDDQDNDVRRDAMWDIKEFLPIAEPAVRSAVELRLHDSDEVVRERAEEALGLRPPT